MRLVRLVQCGDLSDQGVIGVGVTQQGADREEHLSRRQGWRPLILQDVQTDTSIGVNVRVIHLRLELALRGLEGVVGRELDVQEEDTALVGGVSGTHDHGLPVEHVVVIDGTC